MIECKNLSYSYPGFDAAISNITFHISKGEQVGLIGANGAGKSTILKSLVGLVGFNGEIKIDGIPVDVKHLGEIRKKLGYVLQDSDNQMFMPTVIEDMIFGPINYGKSREEAIKTAEEVLDSLGILFLKNRQNYRVSGGEKRMAAIATILAMQPDVMLMDEPSITLDPRNRRNLINILNSLPVTKIIASHDLDMILDTCSRVILISEGKIAADGNAKEILTDKKLLEDNHLEMPFCLSGRK